MFLFTLFSNFSVNFVFFSLFIVLEKAGHQIHHLHNNVVLLNDDSVMWQEDHMIMMILVLVEFVKNDNVCP